MRRTVRFPLVLLFLFALEAIISVLATTPAAAASGLSIVGTAWIDAAPPPAGTVLQALVDGVVCGEGEVASSSAQSSLALSFNLNAAAATEKAGCGADGVVLTFAIGGKPANEKLAWDSASVSAGQAKFIDLSAGEPFAAYSGALSIQGKPVDQYEFPDDHTLLPRPIVIDASVVDPSQTPSFHLCGSVTVGQEGLSTATSTSYSFLVAPPASLASGCGKEGAQLAFRIAGAVIAHESWTPGFHRLDLTPQGPIIHVPTVGESTGVSGDLTAPASGDATQAEASRTQAWWAMIAGSGLLTLLAVAGLAASIGRSRKRG